MKTAKAKVFIFDLECPHCGDYLRNDEDGGCSFRIREGSPQTAQCDDCGEFSKLPDTVPAAKIVKVES